MIRTKRQGLIVWFRQMKNVKQLRRHGHLISVSSKLRYAIIYVDRDQIEERATRLEKLPFVKKVDRSYKPFIRQDFDNTKVDEEKEYDYKMGI